MSGPLVARPGVGLYLPGTVRHTPPSDFAVPNGLVSYWGFDHDCISGASALDLTNNARTGTLYNAPPRVQGKIGGALSFNGTNQYLAVPNTGPNTPTVSMAAWVYPTTATQPAYSVILSRDYATPRANPYVTFSLNANNGSTNYYCVTKALSGSANGYLDSGVAVVANLWIFVAATYDGSALRTYINGVLTNNWADPSGTFYSNGLLSVAAASDGAAPFAGYVDDARIYNRALNASEVLTLYQAGLAGRRDGGGPTLPALFVSGSSYTLSAANGVFTLTGEPAAFSLSLPAAQGSFALTGEPATFAAALAAAKGTFALTGEPATFAAALAAAKGTFTLTGEPAVFGTIFPAANGTFVVTGEPAALSVLLAAANGAFSLTGKPATFTVVTSLTAAPGSFALNGLPATFVIGSLGTPHTKVYIII